MCLLLTVPKLSAILNHNHVSSHHCQLVPWQRFVCAWGLHMLNQELQLCIWSYTSTEQTSHQMQKVDSLKKTSNTNKSFSRLNSQSWSFSTLLPKSLLPTMLISDRLICLLNYSIVVPKDKHRSILFMRVLLLFFYRDNSE